MNPSLNVDAGTSDKKSMPCMSSLPPEVEQGNIEYKLKLVNPSPSRFEHLVTQMKWRLREGQGEAIYEIGVEDNGMLAGLMSEDLDASLQTLSKMAEKLGASTTTLRERTIEGEGASPSRRACEILVRKVPDNQQFIDLRLAVLGNADAGKSTLLGVLTQGEFDNGRGRARLNLFRHLHEIQSGRTSSISHEILGFNSKGQVINYSDSRCAEEICEQASKLITFIDLAGHHKYLKTTIFGLTGHSPDFAMLVVSANTGIVGTTKEHLGLAMALQVPVFVVISKIDLCPPVVIQRTIANLEKILKGPGCNKVTIRVHNIDDAMTAAAHFNSDRICPIFTVSSVSGFHLDLLKRFLNVLPPLHNSKEQEKLTQESAEFQIDEIFSVPNVGNVVGGTLVRGTIKEDDKLLVGPTETGEFILVQVQSIHRNRSACRFVRSAQAATLALTADYDKSILRKGMVLIDPKVTPQSTMCFEADVYVLFHCTSISAGFQTTVHIANVCQTAIMEQIDRPSIQTNQKARVMFRFIKYPEYLREGSRLLFREGRTKGIGQVTKVLPHCTPDR
ncbi:GTP-binding protein 2-like [Saccoglossus kowalevskii]|uniref:GTP-binding protein 2-like n=1 Tax=Saccoglossus kowalevskii TaxID=10224 RepID=A0ABM0GJK0_SACKO|nr:PREDICTED: GTP-binding protein 2-like [Saccoglossus kowalevskii]